MKNKMNHAIRFYNSIKILYKDDPELFSLMIKEFDSVIRNNMYIPSEYFASTVFNDDSAITNIKGKIFITTTKKEYLEYIFELFHEHPQLKVEMKKRLT